MRDTNNMIAGGARHFCSYAFCITNIIIAWGHRQVALRVGSWCSSNTPLWMGYWLGSMWPVNKLWLRFPVMGNRQAAFVCVYACMLLVNIGRGSYQRVPTCLRKGTKANVWGRADPIALPSDFDSWLQSKAKTRTRCNTYTVQWIGWLPTGLALVFVHSEQWPLCLCTVNSGPCVCVKWTVALVFVYSKQWPLFVFSEQWTVALVFVYSEQLPLCTVNLCSQAYQQLCTIIALVPSWFNHMQVLLMCKWKDECNRTLIQIQTLEAYILHTHVSTSHLLVYTRTHTHIYIHTYTHTHTHTYTRTHTHVYTHTHTHTLTHKSHAWLFCSSGSWGQKGAAAFVQSRQGGQDDSKPSPSSVFNRPTG